MIEIKLLPGSEVEITGEILAGDFESYREQVIKKLSQEIKVDGFRPGSVPEKILIEKVGEPVILEKMAIFALQGEYPKIIQTHKIKAIGQPEILITKMARGNPLGYKIKTAVLPEIDLPDYKKIAKETVVSGDAADIKVQQQRRLEILDKIINAARVEIPKILIEAEKNKMLEEIKFSIEQSGLKWEDYLNHLKKTEDELLRDWDKDALKRVKYGLALNEIAEREKIEVPQDELNKEAEKILAQHKGVDPERVRIYTYGIIRNEKVFQFLESC
ncbi:MAG: hypothetical protein HY773_00565 [Candidatus Terrybacteria bacterium]|nr:hypothetical protein [Candidatus Terrybacteria bacterium]